MRDSTGPGTGTSRPLGSGAVRWFRAWILALVCAFALAGMTGTATASTVPCDSGSITVDDGTNTVTGNTNCAGAVTIPNTVTSIGSAAFFIATGLTSVTIPNTVTSIGSGAFSYTGLTSVTIPKSVGVIFGGAFENAQSLASVTFESGGTSLAIGSYAFQGTSLTTINIPSSVTSIGGYTFAGIPSLTSITIPSSVTSIGSGAFQGPTGLTSITIPSSVTSIGDYAFFRSFSLTSLYFAGNAPTVGTNAFLNVATGATAYRFSSATDGGNPWTGSTWQGLNLADWPLFTLTVTKPTGGSITDPGATNIDCGTNNTCSHDYPDVSPATQVTLTATPDTGYRLTGWTGACAAELTTTCTVTMDQARSVSATFTLQTFTLTVTKPTGGAIFDPVQADINCTTSVSTCSHDYFYASPATSATLTATPDAGYTFTGWTGACSGFGTGTCTLTMDQARTVGATFTAQPPANPPPTITSITPAVGPARGGTCIIIRGTNLTSATVTVGGKRASRFSDQHECEAPKGRNTATRLSVTTPSGTPGAADVVVTAGGVSVTASGAFTYVAAPRITRVSPTSGPKAGGTVVTITGSNLTYLSTTPTVTFGGVRGTVTASSPTSITVTAPANTKGAKTIVVTSATGVSGSKSGAFTYR